MAARILFLLLLLVLANTNKSLKRKFPAITMPQVKKKPTEGSASEPGEHQPPEEEEDATAQTDHQTPTETDTTNPMTRWFDILHGCAVGRSGEFKSSQQRILQMISCRSSASI
jgi:hypothetical protein